MTKKDYDKYMEKMSGTLANKITGTCPPKKIVKASTKKPTKKKV